MFDGHRGANRNNVENLFHVSVFQRDAAPCPIASGGVIVNEDLSTEICVLRRDPLDLQRCDDVIVLSTRDKSVGKAAISMPLVRITKLERKVKLALGILPANVELTFRCPSVPRFYLVFYWTQAKPDAILPHQLSG